MILKKLYVAREVILHCQYCGTAYAHDLIGCNVLYGYYVSKKVVLVERDNNGNYLYSDSRKSCKLLDPNDFIHYSDTIGCYECPKAGLHQDGGDCPDTPDIPNVTLGIVDVQPISAFTNVEDLDLAIQLVNEYNASMENRLLLVNDESYQKVIHDISYGTVKSKTKQKN